MKNRTFQSLKLFIGIFLILHVLCPIIALATHISYGDISEVLSSATVCPNALEFISFIACDYYCLCKHCPASGMVCQQVKYPA